MTAWRDWKAGNAGVPEPRDAAGLAPDIQAFMDHCRDEAGMSPASLDAYRRDLKRFSDWFGTDRDLPPDTADIRSFAAAEHRRGLSPRTIQRRLSALRRFFGWLRRQGRIADNPAASVRAPRAGRRLPGVLDTDQVFRLLEIPDQGPVSRRDRAILELFYASGLRLTELARLQWRDLDTEAGLVQVTGKGNKTRMVPVGRHALEALGRWRQDQANRPGTDTEAIFTSTRGGRLSVRAIQARVAHWSRVQGLDQRVHPHLLRHSFASHILESSGDLRAVQELLGHANLSTTQIYTHLDFQHLSEVYDRTHPRARRKP